MSGALQEAQEREKLDVSRHVKVQQTEIADGNSTYSQWVPNVIDIFDDCTCIWATLKIGNVNVTPFCSFHSWLDQT